MKFEIDIQDLFEDCIDETGTLDIKEAIRGDIIDQISTKLLNKLSKPQYSLMQDVNKTIKENIHSLALMGIEKYVQEKCTTINDLIQEKVDESFKLCEWNNDGLPKIITEKIETLANEKYESFDRTVTRLFEENFKVVIENMLDIAFKNFVEKAGINTIWISGREREKKD